VAEVLFFPLLFSPHFPPPERPQLTWRRVRCPFTGFVRHEGPYAAATGSRSPGGNAPIDAFDPSAFSLAGPSARASQAPTRRAPPRAPASQFPDALGESAKDGPYGATIPAGKQDSVSMGFPHVSDAKSAQLMEIYGFRYVLLPFMSKAN
jgi:hypothetical protein